MEYQQEKDQPVYTVYNVPTLLIINHKELYFNWQPLKNNQFKYRCHKSECN